MVGLRLCGRLSPYRNNLLDLALTLALSRRERGRLPALKGTVPFSTTTASPRCPRKLGQALNASRRRCARWGSTGGR